MRELSDFTISDWTAAVIISIGVIGFALDRLMSMAEARMSV